MFRGVVHTDTACAVLTDPRFRWLRPSLKWLSFSQSEVDDTGLQWVTQFKQLRMLSLAGAPIFDAAGKLFAELTSWVDLDLRQNIRH